MAKSEVGMTAALTPMMQQWKECKEQAQGAVLFFRLGDFYEAFHEDAHLLARELGLTLTQRQEVPMCGIPWHTNETYVDRLVARGFTIAIAEQVENTKSAKGLVQRQIVQVISPGSFMNASTLSGKNNTFLSALTVKEGRFGLCLVDLSSNTLLVAECEDEKQLVNELFRYRPKEIVVGKRFKERYLSFINDVAYQFKASITTQEDWVFDKEASLSRLLYHFQLKTLDGFGIKGMEPALVAAGGLVQYVTDTLLLPCDHIRLLKPLYDVNTLYLDRATMTNLELVDPLDEGQVQNTLLHLLDQTKTPMGARLLRGWIKSPLTNLEAIKQRQEALCELFSHELVELEQVRDLERLFLRIKTGYASPREYIALASSCEQIPHISKTLHKCASDRLRACTKRMHDHSELIQSIRQALVDDPPHRISDGRAFKKGYCQELDDLMSCRHSSQEWLASYQTRLREETGIKTLKVGYTKMFGYYIEVSRGQIDKIPSFLQRRQTLVNAERYISQELKEYEEKVLNADAKIQAIEQKLFLELQKSISKYHHTILDTAEAIAEIDVLHSLASVAKKQHYVRPEMDTSNILHIEEGRHPVIETLPITGKFTPNDIEIGEKETLILLTGPNMAGKSTYIRQTALLVIMAHIGSFIPAKRARIGIIDKVFSRIGAADDLARGQSTFMVEMAETASILHLATQKSLVILDEIGRGTSTYDGISIAWAVAEFLATIPQKMAKTLFATHYFELTELANTVPNIANYTVAVSETASGITFLHKIIRGKTDRSYGIHVAKIAGLPQDVVLRAEKLLEELEKKPKEKKLVQADFFEEKPEREGFFYETLRKININSTTPLEAFQILIDLKKKCEK